MSGLQSGQRDSNNIPPVGARMCLDCRAGNGIRITSPLWGPGCVWIAERATGFEPVYVAWKATVLPLNYARRYPPIFGEARYTLSEFLKNKATSPTLTQRCICSLTIRRLYQKILIYNDVLTLDHEDLYPICHWFWRAQIPAPGTDYGTDDDQQHGQKRNQCQLLTGKNNQVQGREKGGQVS